MTENKKNDAEDTPGWLPQPQRVGGLCLVASILLALSAIGFNDDAIAPFYQNACKAIFLLMAMLLIVVPIKDRLQADLYVNPRPFSRHPVSKANIPDLQLRAAASGISASEAEFFAVASTNPRRIRQRIVDTYIPGRRQLQQLVSIDAQIPPSILRALRAPDPAPSNAEPSTAEEEVAVSSDPDRGLRPNPMVHFPVVIPPKGMMLDNFTVSDANGAEISMLSYRESLELAAGILHQLLLVLKAQAPVEADPERFKAAEVLALGQIMRRRPTDGPVVTEEEEKGWEAIAKLPTSKKSERLKLLTVQFSKMLVENFCIVAAVTPDHNGRFFLKYQQTLIPDLDLTEAPQSFTAKFVGRLRIALGTRPAEVSIGVDNAMICQSYHLRLVVSDDLYCSKQRALGFDEILDTRAPDTPTKPHLRFRRRLGQPYAHFYCRYLPQLPAPDPKVKGPRETPRVRFTFIEVPPGSLIRAVIASVFAAALIWLIGIINSYEAAPDTDAPAYLLTFPAVVAAWIGFDAPTGRLFEGTLRARLALLLTAVTSLAATGLFLAHKTIKPDDKNVWPDIPRDISVLGITDLTWAILVTIAVANAVHVCYKYYVLTWHFEYYSSREQGNNDFTQHG